MYKDTDIELKGIYFFFLFFLHRSKMKLNKHIYLLWLLLTAYWGKVFILLVVTSFGCPKEVTFTIQWFLKHYPCHNEYNNIEVSGTCSMLLKSSCVWCSFFVDRLFVCSLRKCMKRRHWVEARVWTRTLSDPESIFSTNTGNFPAAVTCTSSLCSMYVCNTWSHSVL